MKVQKINIAGIESKIIKLDDVRGAVSTDEIKSILIHGKVVSGIYQRIRDGVLVFICSTKAAMADLDLIARALMSKMIDQKKKQVFSITVYQFNH